MDEMPIYDDPLVPASISPHAPTQSQIQRAIAIGLPFVYEFDRFAASYGASGHNPLAEHMSAQLNVFGNAHMPMPTPIPIHAPTLTHSSYTRGRVGEVEIFTIISDVWPGAENVTAKPHSGDILYRCADGRIIVEVKNYNTAVPPAQIDKFLSDLTTRSATAGLFVSIKSAIVGVSGPIVIQYERIGGRYVPVLYLTTPSPDDIRVACAMIVQLVGAIGYANALVRERETLYASLAECTDAADGLSEIRGKFAATIGSVSAQLSEVACELSTCERAVRRSLAAAASSMQDVAPVDIGAHIESNGRYAAYSQELRGAIADVVSAIEARAPGTKKGWLSRGGVPSRSAKKDALDEAKPASTYIHVFTGATLKLLVRSASITMSRSGISGATAIQLLDEFPRHTTVYGDAITITIDVTTAPAIVAIV